MLSFHDAYIIIRRAVLAQVGRALLELPVEVLVIVKRDARRTRLSYSRSVVGVFFVRGHGLNGDTQVAFDIAFVVDDGDAMD